MSSSSWLLWKFAAVHGLLWSAPMSLLLANPDWPATQEVLELAFGTEHAHVLMDSAIGYASLRVLLFFAMCASFGYYAVSLNTHNNPAIKWAAVSGKVMVFACVVTVYKQHLVRPVVLGMVATDLLLAVMILIDLDTVNHTTTFGLGNRSLYIVSAVWALVVAAPLFGLLALAPSFAASSPGQWLLHLLFSDSSIASITEHSVVAACLNATLAFSLFFWLVGFSFAALRPSNNDAMKLAGMTAKSLAAAVAFNLYMRGDIVAPPFLIPAGVDALSALLMYRDWRACVVPPAPKQHLH